MKSKRAVILISLTVTAAALAVAVWLISRAAGGDAPEQEYEKLIDLDPKSITSVSYSLRGAPEISFVCENGRWSCPASPDFPVTQNYLTSIAEGICRISCIRRMDDSADPAEYGLDSPRLIARIGTADGGEYDFTVGSENAHADGEYVLFRGVIYLADTPLTDHLSRERLYDYLTTTWFPELTDVTAVEIGGERYTDSLTVGRYLAAYKELVRGEVADYKDAADYGFDGGETVVKVYYDVTVDVTGEAGEKVSAETGTASFSFSLASVSGTDFVMLQDDDLVYLCTGAGEFLGRD